MNSHSINTCTCICICICSLCTRPVTTLDTAHHPCSTPAATHHSDVLDAVQAWRGLSGSAARSVPRFSSRHDLSSHADALKGSGCAATHHSRTDADRLLHHLPAPALRCEHLHPPHLPSMISLLSSPLWWLVAVLLPLLLSLYLFHSLSSYLLTTGIDRVCAYLHYRTTRLKLSLRPRRLILIRHGESQGNVDKGCYQHIPDNLIQLTARGREQAREVGLQLKQLIGDESVLFYVSPFLRSQQTFHIISEHFRPSQYRVREDPRIREQEWGNSQHPAAMAAVLAERERVGRFFYRFQDGESGADVFDRVSSFMESMFREMGQDAPVQNMVLVSHGLFMRLFLTRFYRWSVERFTHLANPINCELLRAGARGQVRRLHTQVTRPHVRGQGGGRGGADRRTAHDGQRGGKGAGAHESRGKGADRRGYARAGACGGRVCRRRRRRTRARRRATDASPSRRCAGPRWRAAPARSRCPPTSPPSPPPTPPSAPAHSSPPLRASPHPPLHRRLTPLLSPRARRFLTPPHLAVAARRLLRGQGGVPPAGGGESGAARRGQRVVERG